MLSKSFLFFPQASWQTCFHDMVIESLVEFPNIFDFEGLFAEWACVVRLFCPALETTEVEIVSYVAWKCYDLLSLWLELHQANDAVLVLCKLRRIILSSHSIKLLDLAIPCFVASTTLTPIDEIVR